MHLVALKTSVMMTEMGWSTRKTIVLILLVRVHSPQWVAQMLMGTVGQTQPTHSPQNQPNGMIRMAMASEMSLKDIRRTTVHWNTVYLTKIDLDVQIQMEMAGRI